MFLRQNGHRKFWREFETNTSSYGRLEPISKLFLNSYLIIKIFMYYINVKICEDVHVQYD